MSLTKSLCATAGTLTALLIVLSTACDQTGTIDLPAAQGLPDGSNANGSPVVRPEFVAFVSSDRPRLIRDDVTDGSANVQVEASGPSAFDWCVEVIDPRRPTPAEECDNDSDAARRALELLTLAVPPRLDADADFLESVLAILSIIGDPGAGDGTFIRITVLATKVTCADPTDPTTCEDGEDTSRSEVTLQLVRPETELAVVIEVSRTEFAPEGQTTLTAIITGGNAFVSQRSDCTPDEGKFAPPREAPDDQPAYCIEWSVREVYNKVVGGEAALAGSLGERLTLSPPTSGPEGETFSEVKYDAPIATGNVVFTVSVTDEKGNRATTPVLVRVSTETFNYAQEPADTLRVVPGESAEIAAAATGGHPAYDIKYELLAGTSDSLSDLTGLSGTGCTGLSTSEACTVTYTAPSDEVGTAIIRLTMTDAFGDDPGTPITKDIRLTIASAETLAVNATSSLTTLAPGDQTAITAEVKGGTDPYAVCFGFDGTARGTLTLPSGVTDCTDANDEFFKGTVHCICGEGNTAVGSDTRTFSLNYRAPGSGALVTITVRVRDNVGATADTTRALNVAQGAGAVCGDGSTQSGEQCDDGNNLNGDGCSSSCKTEFCGDGVVNNTNEDCELGDCCINCQFTAAATECRASTSACDPAEACTGAAATCPEDVTITACIDGDGCCPTGCNEANDNDCAAICGNGVVEPSEACELGGCCTNCQFTGAGSECRASAGVCDPAEVCSGLVEDCPVDVTITTCIDGDGCCVPGCNEANDNDCAAICGNGIVEPSEDCEAGDCCTNCQFTVAATECRASTSACDPAEACTGAAETCPADVTITTCVNGDGCCLPACNEANDNDCAAICGNGIVEPSEDCESGDCCTNCQFTVAATECRASTSACDPAEACTGAGETCPADVTISTCINSDGCCPVGCNQGNDNDCAAVCGNGIVEPSEDCEIGDCCTNCQFTVAATECRASTSACDPAETCTGAAETCPADVTITTCVNGDGCCLPACNEANDNDCAAICGNGIVEPSEDCESGDCCTNCLFTAPATECRASTGACDPAEACTGAAETCPADVTITTCVDGDGCCLPACNEGNDSDCAAICGNGIVEPSEDCEIGDCCTNCQFTAVATECRASVDACDPAEACTGAAATCPADVTITTCIDGDGCCLPACNEANDNDCTAICGNGIVEPSEDCEIGDCCTNCQFTVVATECRASVDACDPAEACTGAAATCPADVTITTCIDGDGCCVPGCNEANDDDCAAICGNGVVEPSEDCESGDCCTNCQFTAAATECRASVGVCDPAEVCTGAASTCPADVTITACVNGDGCCPTGCNANIDDDCAPLCGNGVVESGEECEAGACCSGCSFISAGTECRAVAGTCDVAETCTGSSADCPGDGFVAGGVECRASTGPCEPAEDCDGVIATCPADDTCDEGCGVCQNGDGCCPTGCFSIIDNDCAPVCGNGIIESGEMCEDNADCAFPGLPTCSGCMCVP